MNTGRLVLIALFALTGLKVAAEPEAPKPIPTVLQFPSSMEATAPAPGAFGSGLLAGWAAGYRNKHTASRIKRFHDWLPDYDIEERMRTTIPCALQAGSSADCRSDILLFTSAGQLQQLLENSPGGHGLIIRIQPLLGLKSFLLHVSTVEVELKLGTLSPVRVFTALYASRVPSSLESVTENIEEPFRNYWVGETPSALRLSVDTGVAEVGRMLGVLYSQVTPRGQIPSDWAKLPNLDALKAAKRVRCSGMPCGGARVLKDGPEGLWLAFVPNMWTSGGLPAEVGSALASLDDNAAKWNTNMWALATAFDDN